MAEQGYKICKATQDFSVFSVVYFQINIEQVLANIDICMRAITFLAAHEATMIKVSKASILNDGLFGNSRMGDATEDLLNL
jgi:hypothetical protein